MFCKVFRSFAALYAGRGRDVIIFFSRCAGILIFSIYATLTGKRALAVGADHDDNETFDEFLEGMFP